MSEPDVFPGRRRYPQARPFRGPDAPLPPDDLLRLYGAKTLDPGTALVREGQTLRPTAYVADRLIVPVDIAPEAHRLLDSAAESLGLRLEMEDPRERVRRLATPLRLRPAEGRAAVTDAWTVLQTARVMDRERRLRRVGLDHVVLSHNGQTIGGEPYDEPHTPTGTGFGAGVAGEYTWTGYAGPLPLAVVLDPPRRAEALCHRPVVAVVDTGCGHHPWLVDGVDRDLAAYGTGPSPEDGGELTQPMDGARPTAAGHGTFISGIIRQLCPDADILAVGLLHADGIATELDLIEALAKLRDEAAAFIDSGGRQGRRVDVVSLSCGFYPEDTHDPNLVLLQTVLSDLGRLGIAVVASAGNDATSRPMYPAAFAPHKTGPVPAPEPGAVPLVSVGALNPDGTVALFSNSADWVLDWELGAALVSTMPQLDYGRNSVAATSDPVRGGRQCVDPDRFTGYNGGGGFGQWSGTSFAAPVLAGRLAQFIAADLADGECPAHHMTSVDQGWAAVDASVPGLSRP
jgi:Subtilase family